jgi:hypothetical protein
MTISTKLGVSLLLVSALISGCAKQSQDIAGSYVSPTQYQNFSCRQLSEEASRISNRAALAIGAQDKKAQNDAVATGVGLVLFWPALFFIKGDTEGSAEVASLKGQMEALELMSTRKSCGITFQKAEAKPKA